MKAIIWNKIIELSDNMSNWKKEIKQAESTTQQLIEKRIREMSK